MSAYLLKHPFISSKIKRLLDERLRNADLSSKSILAKMHALISGDVRDIFDPDGNVLHPRMLPDHIASRIAGIKMQTVGKPREGPDGAAIIDHIIEIKLWNPDMQLTNLAKAFAMFSDKPAGNVTINIVGGLPDDPEWNDLPDDMVKDEPKPGDVI